MARGVTAVFELVLWRSAGSALDVALPMGKRDIRCFTVVCDLNRAFPKSVIVRAGGQSSLENRRVA